MTQRLVVKSPLTADYSESQYSDIMTQRLAVKSPLTADYCESQYSNIMSDPETFCQVTTDC